MAAVDQSKTEVHEGDHELHLQGEEACGLRIQDEVSHVRYEVRGKQNRPRQGADPLASHRVARAGAMEQHTANQSR